ncbi:MBL fold metallo-hydrolase [Amycolatopsis sp. NEAU-NG30]|jgi:glyoxylase-like metal-dependent hydrolase (beta-lactamase superfamily II)|uniref:MBL fold metallo-hydrolase n=1 Tax=Amycolatopsis melonis TaxID=3156488 RepID=A0ABV0LEE2_9PSEU
MRVHHLNCGTMRPLGGKLIDGRPGVFRRATMVCHCLLLETDTGLVLVETGMGTPAAVDRVAWLGAGFVRQSNPVPDPAQTAIAQIRALGFDPADVRDIVLTHLDLDHAGGLIDFPWARVHVYAEELRAFTDPRDAAERSRYRRIQFAHGPQWTSYADTGEPWFGFDAVRQLDGLPPEILLVPLSGHTRGHAGVAVDTGSGWLLNAGDSYFFHGQVDPAAPHCPPGLKWFEGRVETVRGARLDNHRRLRQLVQEHGDEVTVFAAHDETGFLRLSTRSRV